MGYSRTVDVRKHRKQKYRREVTQCIPTAWKMNKTRYEPLNYLQYDTDDKRADNRMINGYALWINKLRLVKYLPMQKVYVQKTEKHK